VLKVLPPALAAGTNAAAPEAVIRHAGPAAGGTLLKLPLIEGQILGAFYLSSSGAVRTNNHTNPPSQQWLYLTLSAIKTDYM
jgi:hypothetical protein